MKTATENLRNTIADPDSPIYGSDIVPWICDVLEEMEALKDEQVYIARILGCPDTDYITTPSNLPNVIRNLKSESVKLRAALLKERVKA